LWKPDLGDYLGDLTDEVPDNRIIEFVTGGPKNYAYKIARPDKDGNTTICKVRGITLNYKNSLTINFDTIKDIQTNHIFLTFIYKCVLYSGTSCPSSVFLFARSLGK
jgi:hypothetical protein